MKPKSSMIIIIASLALMMSFSSALAHGHIQAGDYDLVIGFHNEPAVQGLPNALDLFVTNSKTGEKVKGLEDAGIRAHEANQMIADAIDLLVQIGIRHEVRRVLTIGNIARELNGGEVWFKPIYRYVEDSPANVPCWEKVGDLVQRIVLE